MPVAQLTMLDDTTTLHQGWLDFRVEKPTYASERSRKNGFLRYAARKTHTPLESVTATVTFCKSCDLPALTATVWDAQSGSICAGCVDAYRACDHCHDLTPTAEQVDTLTQTSICIRCSNRDYRYCQTCRGHYSRVYRADHNHGQRGCCISPQRTFTIQHIGASPLQNDTRVDVSLPSGEISDEGLEQIRRHVSNQQHYEGDWEARRKWQILASDIDELGAKWQTKQGNYTKRLSSLAYKKHKLKTPAGLMTMIGNVARDHSQGVDFHIEVTRELNRGARAFGYPGSCWWSSYSRSRCAHKTNGGFALRCFSDTGVSGRAWVLPLRRDEITGTLTPTFETMTPDAFVVFNGYGKLSGYTGARVLGHLTGMTYRKVNFSCRPMYINAGAGYVVATEELAKDYTDSLLTLVVAQHSTLFNTENPVLAHA